MNTEIHYLVLSIFNRFLACSKCVCVQMNLLHDILLSISYKPYRTGFLHPLSCKHMTTFMAERNTDMIVHYNLGQSVIFFFAAHMLSHSVLCADLVPSIGQIILRTRISGYHFKRLPSTKKYVHLYLFEWLTKTSSSEDYRCRPC